MLQIQSVESEKDKTLIEIYEPDGWGDIEINITTLGVLCWVYLNKSEVTQIIEFLQEQIREK